LKTIIDEKAISRAELSKLLDLNKTSVSAITADLLDRQLIIESGSGESSGGRKPTILNFNQKAGYALAFDVGSDYISSLLTYLDGTFVLDAYQKVEKMSAGLILETITEEVKKYAVNLKDSPYGIVGISIGIHGIVKDNELIFSPFYEFDGLDLKKELESLFNVPVLLENEANLAALGERHNLEEDISLINLSVKHGIGAGVIVEGHLFTGANGRAGEIGHIIAERNGKPCPCGNHGCLELYGSEDCILAEHQKIKKLDKPSFNSFKKDYLNGCKETLALMEQFTEYMSIAVNNLITSFNPEIIIINSRFTNQFTGIVDEITSKLQYKGVGKTVVRGSALGSDSTLLGGIYLGVSEFLDL
jgi:predicted NBD/HSP70 family sugar kinase